MPPTPSVSPTSTPSVPGADVDAGASREAPTHTTVSAERRILHPESAAETAPEDDAFVAVCRRELECLG